VERRKWVKKKENRYRKLGERKEMVKQEKRKGDRTGNKHSKVQRERKRNKKGIKNTEEKNGKGKN
jgi:hypothetical protein